MFRSLIPSLFSLRKSSKQTKSQRLHSGHRILRCETLEDRRVLATFTVTTAADSGAGSLRQALADADGSGGMDNVVFSAAMDNMTISLTSASLIIDSDVHIDATNLSKLTIDASPLDATPGTADGQGERVFDVLSGDTEFHGLTIMGGDTLEDGGAIRTTNSISITQSHFLGNRSFANGSAISVSLQSGDNNIAVDIADSTFSNNGNLRWDFGGGAQGGAVFMNSPESSSGNSLTVTDTVFEDNGTAHSTGPSMFGGALYFYGKADVTIANSTFTGNSSFEGSGGAANVHVRYGSVDISESVFSGNTAARAASSATSIFGGGVYIYAYQTTATVTDSTITGNTAGGLGGGLGLYASYSAADLSRITVDNNSALTPDQSGYGGGILLSSVNSSEVTLSNSTISGNQAGQSGGGGQLYLSYDSSTLELDHVTVVNNTAAIGQNFMARGGGLNVIAQPNFEVEIRNSLLANNVGFSGDEDLAGNVRSDFSLIETRGVSVIVGANNILDVDPNIGPLADNGGLTMTHGLMLPSPAIDAGDPSVTSGLDQRGLPRVSDGDGNGSLIVDMGAFELELNNPPVANVSLSQNTGIENQPITLNGTRSSDADGHSLTYQWSVFTQPNGSNPVIASPTSAATTFTADIAGLYRVELVVSDGIEESAPVRFRIDVFGNETPTANVSLSSNTGPVNSPVPINGTRSTDPQDDPLTYQWSIVDQPDGSNPVIANPTAAATTWMSDVAGDYRVQLVVSDGTNSSVPVRFLSTLTSSSVPIANVSLSQNSGAVSQPITLNGTRSSDSGMNPLTYQWSIVDQPAGSNPIIANPTAAITTWTADVAGDYRVELVVNNGIEDSLPVRFLSQVSESALPTANVSLSQNSGTVGMDLTLNGSRSSDPNDLPLTYLWSVVNQPPSSNFTIGDSTAAITTFNADTAGEYRVRLVVSNGTQESLPIQFLVTFA